MRQTTGSKGLETPSQRSRLAEQRATAETNRAWHHSRAAAAEKRAASAAVAKRKAGPTGGRLRALARLAELLGETPVTRQAVRQQVDRDRRGRMVAHVNPTKDRSLAGKARIRARRAARR